MNCCFRIGSLLRAVPCIKLYSSFSGPMWCCISPGSLVDESFMFLHLGILFSDFLSFIPTVPSTFLFLHSPHVVHESTRRWSQTSLQPAQSTGQHVAKCPYFRPHIKQVACSYLTREGIRFIFDDTDMIWQDLTSSMWQSYNEAIWLSSPNVLSMFGSPCWNRT